MRGSWMETRWGVASDTGGRRQVNEDAVLAESPVFVVADGMGGHARGDMASSAVVAELRALAREAQAAQRALVPDDVAAAVRRAGAAIRATMSSDDDGDPRGSVAGSTVTGAILTEQDGEPFWLVFNVGDSRVYRSTPQGMEQISVDHSLVQEMVDAGTISRSEARHHPRRNVITRAVGTGPDPQVDFWMLRVADGERLLLCSDGLLGELEDEVIAEVLREAPHPHEAAVSLLERALVGGGANDNVSVIVVEAQPVAHDNEQCDERSSGATLPRTEAGAQA
ncbi:PP2C family protein-serine/threonine phosphatase [Georgenia sunbinii]|uniref:PP2C family protein-serine/threonine phosphatase n=1 Tax=Georgenia sunbinii TaxID=3117728 RepID=UPI002F26352A